MIHVVLNDPSKSDIVFDKITPDELKNAIKRATTLAVDLKVTGLDPMEDDIKAVTIATSSEEIYVLTTEVISPTLLIEIFGGKTLIVHSGLKEMSFLAANGVLVDKVFDTCLTDQVCQGNVNRKQLSYDLPNVLDRYKIPHSFRFYERGTFWKEGFSVGGCNYLSLYVRHLFDLKTSILREHPQSSNLFLMVNKLLLISSEMNVTPLKLDKNLFMAFISDFLEEICAQEARLIEMFDTIGDSPGIVKDHLFPPDGLEKIEPIYDVDDDDIINAFLDRCDYNPAIEMAYEAGMLDVFPSAANLDKYKRDIHLYNEVYMRILHQKDENIYCHYTPITPKSLSIGCVKNFPRPTMAKKNKIPISASFTIHPYSIIKDNIFDTSQYEMRAFEVKDIEVFGLALLACDRNLMRLVQETSIEINDLVRCLESKNIEVPSKKSLTEFVKRLFASGFSTSDGIMSISSVDKKYHGSMMQVISNRYHHAVETISGVITRMSQSGDAIIFGEYPLGWKNFPWYKEMEKRMDSNFWEDYNIHQEAQDDVYQSVQRHYEEYRNMCKVVRDRVIDFCRLYVMSKIMDEFRRSINEENFNAIIRFTYGDKDSFILSYPVILSERVDQIESTTMELLNRRFGDEVPIISTIL
jgi:hypothetical protein